MTDLWAPLRAATPARIGLGRAGDTLPLSAVLDLQLAHARARDAVHAALDPARLEADLAPLPVLHVASAAPDRATYLRRPDLGRQLAPDTRFPDTPPADLAFVIADGLSATGVQAHAASVLRACIAAVPELTLAPITIARQARVALGDPIGAALKARIVVVLIGERPGLSVADSLGLYMTHAPRPGLADSERNCISNIHGAGGLSPEQAAQTLRYLLHESLRLGLSGIALKDDQPAPIPAIESQP